MGLDEAGSAWGWWVDNVKMYSCSNANVDTYIAGTKQENYIIPVNGRVRPSYAGADTGPLQVVSTNGTPIVAALRDLWSDGTVNSSSIQVMGLPAG